MTKSSPYLIANRTQDVIAAISAMATDYYYIAQISHWEKFIGKRPSDTKLKWEVIFQEHPEFFRIGTKADGSVGWGLVMRMASKPNQQTGHIERLNEAQISTLINAALALHTNAITLKRDSKWWITPLVSFFGAIAGVVLSAYLSPPK